MAVYTQLSESDIKDFLSSYDAGELKSFKGITEGVSNTNYLLTVDLKLPGLLPGRIPSPIAGEGWVGGNAPSHREYLPFIKEFARSLRKNQTEAEKKLWGLLRKNSLSYKFRRQVAIDSKYIADFVCLEKRLIIEIDGGQHSENIKDIERTLYLKEQDFRVIRFWNNEILQNLEGCYEILMLELNKDIPHPTLPRKGGGHVEAPQGGRAYGGAVREGAIQTNYILTLFEDNFNSADLPFFMRLTEYLAENGIVCPHPIKNKIGGVVGNIKSRPAVLIEFLQGRGNPHITPRHLWLVGELVARLHLATENFKQKRENALSLAGLKNMFAGFSGKVDEIQIGLRKELENEFAFLAKNFPKDLPAGIVHTDIFPDNVFFIDGNTDQPELSGIIDFYFSCHDFYMYDLMIVVNAWCFNSAHEFVFERAAALFDGYNSRRRITLEEKEAMNILGRAAAMRFLMTRARDWLSDTGGALVNKKDPMEYVKKLHFWQHGGIDDKMI